MAYDLEHGRRLELDWQGARPWAHAGYPNAGERCRLHRSQAASARNCRLTVDRGANVRFGSWLCENAKMPEGDRTSYSSKTVFTPNLASEFNSENELKNVILAAFRSFAFLHDQGHKRTWLQGSG